MSLLNLVDVGKYFGARAIFEGVSFTLAAGEKVALVGRNGVGKTTLLKAIAGEIDADAGNIFIARTAKVGFLTQDTEYASHLSVYDEMRGVFADILDMGRQMAILGEAMAAPEVHQDADRLGETMAQYARLQDEYERAGGYMVDTRIKTIIYGLGFDHEAMSRPVSSFSGGEKVRLRLGKLLLAEPSLLLLDEPTNHLDLRATEWLEDYMKTFPGAILVVSHDRYFLDMVAQKVVELERGRATVYPGNYSAYVALKEERRILAEATRERQEVEAAKLQAFVDKWKAGTKSTMAKSREKALARLEMVEVPQGSGRSANIRFTASERSGKEVVRANGLYKCFDDRQVFEPFSLTVERGDRVGIIGRNGAGKSTLLRMLMGLEEPSGGAVEFGSNVSAGYFSQSLDDLDPSRSIVEEVEASCGLLRERVRTILGALLFTGEEVFKPISILSGGERNRVCLAKLLVGNHNLLVLDEPTNHLDISAKDALEKALGEYTGTVLLVSHDRYFLDHIVNRVLDIDDGKVTYYKGNYSEYRQYKAASAQLPPVGQQERQPADGGPVERTRPARDNTERIRKRLLARLSELEDQIACQEEAILRLEELMASPELYNDVERSRQVVMEHTQAQERLAEMYSEWEEASQASELR